jgi:hypothetical protein
MGPDLAADDADFPYDHGDDAWDDEPDQPGAWTAVDGLEHAPDAAGQEAAEDADPDQSEAVFYETDPVFVMLRQAAIGWCNIYAAILPGEARSEGLRILFHIGRALANLAYSIDDGMYEHPPASVAFAKRSLAQLNVAIGLINQLMHDRPRSKRILTTIREHLVKANDAIVDHLQRCRHQTGAGRV